MRAISFRELEFFLFGEADGIRTREEIWAKLGHRPNGPLESELRRAELLEAAYRMTQHVRRGEFHVFDAEQMRAAPIPEHPLENFEAHPDAADYVEEAGDSGDDAPAPPAEPEPAPAPSFLGKRRRRRGAQ